MTEENKKSGGDDLWVAIIFFFVICLILFVIGRSCEAVNEWWDNTTEEISVIVTQKIEIIRILFMSVMGVLGLLAIVAIIIRGTWQLRRFLDSKKEVAMFVRKTRQ